MSTEARRAPVPPRPTAPPAPATTPAPQPPTSAAPVAAAGPRSASAPVTGAPAQSAGGPAPRPAAPGAPAPAVPPRPGTPPAATRRRPVGAVDMTPPPGAAPLPGGYAHPGGHAPAPYRPPYRAPYPETPAETTTRLRPVRTRRPVRTATAAVCVVLGLGLIGGAATGAWLTSDSSAEPGARSLYTTTRAVWHSVPVDTLFPRTLTGTGAGPGGADRVWTRVAVAPDGGCATALDPLLLKALRPVGCARLLRATYADATSSSVTTVGLLFTEGDSQAMRTLAGRFTGEHLDRRSDLMPRAFAAGNTVAAGFGDRQRASWRIHVLTEVPVVVFAVSGFADGRPVTGPLPADEAMAADATGAVAQAGLGHEAKGIADRIERELRRTLDDRTEKPE